MVYFSNITLTEHHYSTFRHYDATIRHNVSHYVIFVPFVEAELTDENASSLVYILPEFSQLTYLDIARKLTFFHILLCDLALSIFYHGLLFTFACTLMLKMILGSYYCTC